jgi:hypothetical protein
LLTMAKIPKVPKTEFEAVIKRLLKASPHPLSAIPKKRKAARDRALAIFKKRG